jgi:hypothetical protein
MSKSLPRKAVIAISSFHGAIYPNGHKTGLFLVEALQKGPLSCSRSAPCPARPCPLN